MNISEYPVIFITLPFSIAISLGLSVSAAVKAECDTQFVFSILNIVYFCISSTAFYFCIFHLELNQYFIRVLHLIALLFSPLGNAALLGIGFQLSLNSDEGKLIIALLAIHVSMLTFKIVFNTVLLVLWYLGSEFAGKSKTLEKSAVRLDMISSITLPIEVDFVKELGGNRGNLGMSISPGRKKGKWNRDLTMDVVRMKEFYNIGLIVTLLQDYDMRNIHNEDLFRVLGDNKIKYIHFPVRDKWIPSSINNFVSLIKTIVIETRLIKVPTNEKVHQIIDIECKNNSRDTKAAEINSYINDSESNKDKLIASIHCNGGKGRTATVVVCCLIVMGYPVGEAIQMVRRNRKGTLRNPLQIIYVHLFRLHWQLLYNEF
jgi:hypothetical protein